MTTTATMFSATLSNTVETARKPRRTTRRYRIGLVSLPVVLLATSGAGCTAMPRITTTSDVVTLMHLKALRDDLVATDWHYDPARSGDATFVRREVPHRYAGDWSDVIPAWRGALRFAGPTTHLRFSPRETSFTLTSAEWSRPAALIESTTLTLKHGSDLGNLQVPIIANQRTLDQPVVLTMMDQESSRREAKTSASQGLIPLSVVAVRHDAP